MNKVVLAFSGGLDTSVCIKYLQKLHNLKVITLTVDVGQGDDFDDIKKISEQLGAIDHIYLDCREEFCRDYIIPAIKANAMYQQKYPLATALARPLIASKCVEIAQSRDAEYISHGCTGKGNDQVRFDITIKSLNNKLKIIAPIRDLNLTRDKEIEFARDNGIQISDISKKYSIDENIWGRSIEGGILENLDVAPPEESFKYIKFGNNDKVFVDVEFREGIPISVNGKMNNPIEIIRELNYLGGSHGVGIVDHIEDRIVGIKSREIYENPAALILLEAHRDLEKLVLTNHEIRFKTLVDDQWSWLTYSGLWLDPLLADLNSFINKTQEKVTGTVKLRLQNGSYRVVGRKSEFSLYDEETVTYLSSSNFDQTTAKGFVELWGLQSIMANSKILHNRRIKDESRHSI